MSQGLRGVLAMVAASTIWGLSSLYYKLLSPVPPLEVLAHRTLWSLVLFAVILSARGRLGDIRAVLRGWRGFWLTAFAAVMISGNWFGFIYAVQVGRAMEASLGYYIFPLMAVLLGMVFFGARLRPLQWVAVGFALIAVVILTLGLGVAPELSIFLALSFGIYGALKRVQGAEPMVSVAAEVTLLAPVALIWLAGAELAGWSGSGTQTGGVFGHDLFLTCLLVLSGPMTGIPLLLFSYASQRISMPTIGVVQYLNPSLQFLCATLVLGEAFTFWHAIAFPLIWTGLAIYSWDGWTAYRRTQPSGTGVTSPVAHATPRG